MIDHLGLARELAGYLNDNVLEEEGVDDLSILDALGSLGFVLLPDSSGAASRSYIEAITS